MCSASSDKHWLQTREKERKEHAVSTCLCMFHRDGLYMLCNCSIKFTVSPYPPPPPPALVRSVSSASSTCRARSLNLRQARIFVVKSPSVKVPEPLYPVGPESWKRRLQLSLDVSLSECQSLRFSVCVLHTATAACPLSLCETVTYLGIILSSGLVTAADALNLRGA